MGIVKCVVPGCEDRRSPRHRFPVFDQELYEEWLKRIGRKELINLDPKFVGSNKRICSIHFSNHCRVPNSTKLKHRSLPTLHLREFKEKPSEVNSILKYSNKTQTISKTQLIRDIKDFKHDDEESEDDGFGDWEPVTIDFTYLMNITSLPDTPLIEEPAKEGLVNPQRSQVVVPNSATVGFQSSVSKSLHSRNF